LEGPTKVAKGSSNWPGANDALPSDSCLPTGADTQSPNGSKSKLDEVENEADELTEFIDAIAFGGVKIDGVGDTDGDTDGLDTVADVEVDTDVGTDGLDVEVAVTVDVDGAGVGEGVDIVAEGVDGDDVDANDVDGDVGSIVGLDNDASPPKSINKAWGKLSAKAGFPISFANSLTTISCFFLSIMCVLT